MEFLKFRTLKESTIQLDYSKVIKINLMEQTIEGESLIMMEHDKCPYIIGVTRDTIAKLNQYYELFDFSNDVVSQIYDALNNSANEPIEVKIMEDVRLLFSELKYSISNVKLDICEPLANHS